MESSWHRNVVDYGLCGWPGFSVCARMLDQPPGYILTNAVSAIPELAVSFILPDTADHPYGFGLVSGGFGLHFPYGHRVEPDVPL